MTNEARTTLDAARLADIKQAREEANRALADRFVEVAPPCDCDRSGILGSHEDHCSAVVA